MKRRPLPITLRVSRPARAFVALMAVGSLVAQTPDWDALASGTQEDLKKSLAELAEVRRSIEADKLPLVQQVNALEQQVIEERAALQKAERFQENQLVELNQLRSQVRARSEEVKYLDSLLAEYARAFRTRTHVIEAERVRPMLDRVDAAAASLDLDADEKLARRAEMLEASIARLREVAGGTTFEASVLGPRGQIEKGRVALVGPVAVFASDQSDATGLVQQELNKADPSLFQLSPELSSGVRQLATTGSGPLSVDATMGNAIKIASIRETPIEHFVKGGVVMWPILLRAGTALVITNYKWVQLSKVRLVSSRELQTVIQQVQAGDSGAAMKSAQAIPGPAGQLLVAAVEHSDEKKEYVEEVLYEHMLNTKPKLEALIPFVGLTAAAAPLLGLLGTVTGMIATFQMISVFGTGDPRTMSSGISEALITTESGLYVAIPAVLAHAFLTRKAKAILGSMEQTAVSFINGLPEDSIFRT